MSSSDDDHIDRIMLEMGLDYELHTSMLHSANQKKRGLLNSEFQFDLSQFNTTGEIWHEAPLVSFQENMTARALAANQNFQAAQQTTQPIQPIQATQPIQVTPIEIPEVSSRPIQLVRPVIPTPLTQAPPPVTQPTRPHFINTQTKVTNPVNIVNTPLTHLGFTEISRESINQNTSIVNIYQQYPQPLLLHSQITQPPILQHPTISPPSAQLKTMEIDNSSPDSLRSASKDQLNVPTEKTGDKRKSEKLDKSKSKESSSNAANGGMNQASKKQKVPTPVDSPPDEDKDDDLDDDEEQKRRYAHIHAEQKRRNNLKLAFNELKSAVPSCKDKSLSKVLILKAATECVKSLLKSSEEVEAVKKENEELRKIIENYRKRSHKLVSAEGVSAMIKSNDSKINHYYD